MTFWTFPRSQPGQLELNCEDFQVAEILPEILSHNPSPGNGEEHQGRAGVGNICAEFGSLNRSAETAARGNLECLVRSNIRNTEAETIEQRDSIMHSRPLIIRHGLLAIVFVLSYVLLNRPEVIFFSRIGFVAWYPAIGLVMALLLGVSPWYAFLACLADVLTGRIVYAQPASSFSNTLGAAGIALCYGSAAYLLRGAMQIDLGLRRRRDVVRYVLVSAAA